MVTTTREFGLDSEWNECNALDLIITKTEQERTLEDIGRNFRGIVFAVSVPPRSVSTKGYVTCEILALQINQSYVSPLVKFACS